MKVCACVLLFTIFALIKASCQTAIKHQNLKQATDDKLHTNEKRTLAIARGLLAKSKALNKVPRVNVRPARVTTFTGFIQQAIQILNTYEDTAFGDFFDILDEELTNYHYKGCKFNDFTKNHDTRRLLQTKINLIRGKPVPVTKAHINALADILKNERYDKQVKNFVDYINSLYVPDTADKFERVLNELEYYSKHRGRRLENNLAQVVQNGLRTLIFDYYTNLHVNAKIALKEKIQALLNRSRERTTSSFKIKRISHVSSSTTNFDISENVITFPVHEFIPIHVTAVPPADSSDLEEASSIEARANKAQKVEKKKKKEDSDSEAEDYIRAPSSSNSIEYFQEKQRQFNTQRYITLFTEAFDEVHDTVEEKHKRKTQTSDENSKYFKGLKRHAIKHIDNKKIDEVYNKIKHKRNKNKKHIARTHSEEAKDNNEAKNNGGAHGYFISEDIFKHKRKLNHTPWLGARHTPVYRRDGSHNKTAVNTNEDLVRRVSILEKQLQEFRREMIIGHATDGNNSTDAVTKELTIKNNKTTASTVPVKPNTIEVKTKTTKKAVREVNVTEPFIFIVNRAHEDFNDTNTTTTVIHSTVNVTKVSKVDTRLYDNVNVTTNASVTSQMTTLSTRKNLRRFNTPTHPAADYTYIELRPFDHIHGDDVLE